MKTSPFDMEILIHYYAVVGPYPHPKNEVYYDSVTKFVNMGLITKVDTDREYASTDLLKDYVERLMSVPLVYPLS